MEIPLQGPSDNHPGEFYYKVQRYNQQEKFRYQVQIALLYDGNPARRSNEHCSTKKTITTFCYQQCITTIIFYSYFHKSIIKYNKGWLYSGGASLQRRIIIFKALICLNFFDFQIFENLSFNDFSIVIENLPESNGYIFLSMTRKF